MLHNKGFPEEELIKIRTETTTTEPTHVIPAFISCDNSQIKLPHCCKPSVLQIATAHKSKNKSFLCLLRATKPHRKHLAPPHRFSPLTSGYTTASHRKAAMGAWAN